MTVRKQLVGTIIILVFLAIIMNSLISTRYIDNYFKGFVSEQYNNKVENIKAYGINLLSDGMTNTSQSEIELGNYISDPIVQISIFNKNGETLITVQDSMFNMHSNMMMGRKYNTEEDLITIEDNGNRIGLIVITRNSAIHTSDTVKLFKNALLWGTLISGSLVLIIAFVMTTYLSNRMTKDLRMTAQFAKAIEMESLHSIKHSNVVEIRGIQTSLENLETKLKLQKNVRKEKADQLAHEARTPLTILKTHCEGVIDGVVDMDQSRLESCINEIDNLSGLLSNINDVVEYEESNLKLNIEEFDLISELKKVIKGLKLQFEKKGIKLEMEGRKHLNIVSDRSVLSQTIYNLLTNAYKFTSEGGKVSIHVDNDKMLKILVRDTGIGIDDFELNRIFEAYYRSSLVRTIQGDGLGLFITKRNIEALGGEISVTSVREVGTQFMIQMPLFYKEN